MSHMDPVSGTDIDLFIEGIIPDSLHLYRKERGKNRHLNNGFKCKNEMTTNARVVTLPVDELKYLLLLELLIKSCGCCQLLLFLQALLVQVTLKQRVAGIKIPPVLCNRPDTVFGKIDLRKTQTFTFILQQRCYNRQLNSGLALAAPPLLKYNLAHFLLLHQ